MKVSIEELEPGDEIIISSYSSLKYMRILERPSLSKTKKSWSTGLPMFKAVKCLICRKQKEGHSGYKYSGYELDPDDLNVVIRKDLADRDIWLVKKGNK